MNYSHQDVTETELHTGRNYRVSRITDPVYGPLIVKKAREDGDPDAIAAIRNEYRILERLRRIDTCPIPVRFDPVHGELSLKEFEGDRLDRSGLPGKLDLERFLYLSEALARAVEAIHGRGVIHKELKPANVLINPVNFALQIVNFDFATTFAEEYPPFGHLGELRGDLLYLSPEQTGRMNRPVDYRTDLYSLGAILYALATGAPPFTDSDRLGLIHAHLARTPIPPKEVAPWLPNPVSELILALIAKEPDDRYQSATGVAHDLRLLRDALAINGSLDETPLKTCDPPLSIRPPRRLYGRSREISMLEQALTSVIRGGARGLFVTGYSGVGKTSLVNEIHRPVTLNHGSFISGKFDQFQRDRPFLAPARSLRQLCQLLLAEPESVAEEWRRRLLEGLGPDAGALFEVVPELESLLGPQAPVPELGPLEARLRFRTLLTALLRQVAGPAHPLVMFLDDLQWADQSSLDFVTALLEESTIDGLLVIGAYRDNEVDAAHPLMRVLQRFTSAGGPARVLALSGLDVTDLGDLLADMLHMPSPAVQALARVLYSKTRGNPFFTIEFLKTLYREGSLSLHPGQRLWEWDAEAVAAHQASASVVETLSSHLAELPYATSELLVAAACLGGDFTLGTLSLATCGETGQIVELLAPALECGIIVTSSSLAFQRADGAVVLRFSHDRMQQAVYNIPDDEGIGRLHLAMARRFADAWDDPGHRFSAAEHYAVVAHLIVDDTERKSAQRLFLLAAVQARQAGSFVTAEHFLRRGFGLMVMDSWRTDPDSSFDLHAELHLVLYCQGRHSEADEIFDVLKTQAGEPLRLVGPTCVQVMSLSNRTRYDTAVGLSGAMLERLGVSVPLKDTISDLQRDLGLFYRQVAAGGLEGLKHGRGEVDSRLNGIAKLISRTIPAAFFTRPLVSFWLAVHCGLQWLNEGYSPYYIYPTATISLATIGLRGDYATGYRAASTALTIGLEREHGVETARVHHVMGLFNAHWFQPLEDDINLARAAFDGLMRGSELEFGCYTFFTSLAAVLDVCPSLGEMNSEVSAALGFARKTGNRHGEQSFIVFQQLVRALEGNSASPGSFNDAEFDEKRHLDAIQGNPMALCFFHIYRAMAAELFRDDEALTEHAGKAVGFIPYITGFYPTVLATLLHSLALIRQIREASGEERSARLATLADHLKWLGERAADAPQNVRHLCDLVEAEWLDVVDHPWDAIRLFEQAMKQVRGQQRQWHYALIVERAGLCHMRRGLEHTGRTLLISAHDLYQKWGAKGKTRAMRHEWPFIHAGYQDDGKGGSFDYEALLRASQALASEMTLHRLVMRFVELVGQLTGATDVRLLIPDEEGHWFLEGGISGAQVIERISLVEAKEICIVAPSVLRLGLRTLMPVISDDAVIDTRFRDDPHFSALSLCSLLALPVLFNGRVISFLTLEHRLVRAAFSVSQIETISLLCSQLSISLENIRLYRSLEQKVAERTRALEEANQKLECLSFTDGLTGVANRRCLDQTLSAEWRRAFRSRKPIALAMLDVDLFKKYNDHYGHQEGDECLQTIARVLQGQVRRDIDTVARYGGEEFILIAPETNAEGIMCLAERVRAAMESEALEHVSSPYGVVTVSMGAASRVPESEDDQESLIQQADASLYQAKHQGRNRVVLSGNNSGSD